jgi:FAD:protein FMN transferase
MHRVEMIMGTAITLDIIDASSDLTRLGDDAFAWFTEVDARFSTYKDDSEVGRLDRGEITVDQASPDLRHVLDACESLRDQTRGFFDAYATGRLDPSGYVKGWSVQVAADRLRAAGIENFCINAGGDIRVHGVGPDGDAWRIGIRHPWEADKVAWVIAGTDLAIATSGTYERGPHVIDPFRGQPSTFLRSVTVVGRDLAVVDAYATAAVAMGKPGLDWLAQLTGYESAAVTENGEAFRSDGFPTARRA